jgi:NTP pyrophosphatase (non-canonical NTP hydrolase)
MSDSDEVEGLIRPDSLNEMLHALGHEMHDDSTRWFGSDVADSLTILTLGLGGESGEVQDIIKKVMRGSTTLDDPETRSKLAEELVDVFIYWCMMITALQIDIEQCYALKREINQERFGA